MRDIIIIEDDAKIGALMRDYLAAGGYRPAWHRDGGTLLDDVIAAPPAAIILDVMLPRMDGFALCERLRRITDIPILFVTARVEEADRLRGLQTGADDYVCKPFSMRELVARVDALVRRSEGRVIADPERLRYGIDDHSGRIAWAGQWLGLSRSEFRLLAAMMRAPGRIFTRNELLDRISEEFRDVSDRAIDSHLKNIRKKIDTAEPGARPIVSVYGVGYRFDAEAR